MNTIRLAFLPQNVMKGCSMGADFPVPDEKVEVAS